MVNVTCPECIYLFIHVTKTPTLKQGASHVTFPKFTVQPHLTRDVLLFIHDPDTFTGNSIYLTLVL